jgi:hypothetical protein
MLSYARYWSNPYTCIPYTIKPFKFYFHIPEIKKINSIAQLNFDILPKLYTEVPILTALHSYNSQEKIHYLPLPLKNKLSIEQYSRINSFIDRLDTYSYYIYKTKKETNHFIGGTSVLFDADYNLLFLITAKAVQIPLEHFNREFFEFSHTDFIGRNSYNRNNFIFRDTTINVSSLLINKALNSKIYNSILMDLIHNADSMGWKFVIDKNLQEKWIKTPVAPKLEDVKTPLNLYIKKELNDIMNNIYTYD